MKIARDGLKFILPALALAIVCLILRWWPLVGLFLILASAFAFFFRNPERVPPPGEGRLVAPADGQVLGIDPSASSTALDGPATRITIFLSLFNVHVTRSPVAGTVGRVEYRPGKFLPAYRPEAGEHNESCSLDIRGGPSDIFLRQIVGVAARRIKCFVKSSDRVARGQRIGLMYFGSRIELDLPSQAEVKVRLHQKIRAGETVIAEVKT
jgi:phosphatidylserine decarboxylase